MEKIRQHLKINSFAIIGGLLFEVVENNKKHWKVTWETLPKKTAKRKAKPQSGYIWTTSKHFKGYFKKKKGIVISETDVKLYKKEGV